MNNGNAIGIVETSSIAKGFEIADAMLKTADVRMVGSSRARSNRSPRVTRVCTVRTGSSLCAAMLGPTLLRHGSEDHGDKGQPHEKGRAFIQPMRVDLFEKA